MAEKKEEKKPEKKAEEKQEEQPPEKAEAKEEKKEEKKAEEKKPEKEERKEEKQPPRKPKKRRHAVVHVYSSKNDTIITATDLSGAETLAWASGGMVVKSHREEGRPYAAMQAALRVVNSLKGKGITHVGVKIRAPGGVGMKTPGSGAQAVVRTIARTGIRIGRIEDVTPLPTDSMKRKGGRRGRRV
ncbi:30S ribosomal protein S11 [Candidatus Micrarchaeota archaeon]|nr:30S ribosomal protein S11 [Candidatus Micrarchaeota archaeon]